MKRCFSCGKELDIKGRPGRGDACPFCDADLRVCFNCRFYDEAAHNRCREPQAERVVERDRANFCEYFEFGASEGCADEKPDKKEEAMKKLRELFRK